MVKKIDAVIKNVASGLCHAATALTLFLVAVVVADVLLRNLFQMPIVGTPVFARNALIGLTYLALPYVTLTQKHVRSEFVSTRLKEDGLLKKALDVIACLVGFVVFVLLARSLWNPTVQAIRRGEVDREALAAIPLVPFYLACLAASVLSAIAIAWVVFRMFYHEKGRCDPRPNSEFQ